MQSPFIGRRVQLVEDGVPILYSRYTSVAQVLVVSRAGNIMHNC